jgi:mannan endo-1,4-beta-mannosidase
VVSSAESHGIKLIINFVNNWGDYGGMAAYNKFYGTSASTWYTDSRVQTQYKAYISAVVSRYKSSSAIFAWELANEPRCNGCSTSVITNWATTISSYIKGLDSSHMVTLGDEGFMNGGGDGSYPYTTGEGIDFAANLKVPNLDFGVFHLYPGSWGVSNDWANAWISNHGVACAAAKKPCILEEYGVSSNHAAVEGPWQKTALSSNGIAGDMFWQYGDTISSGKTADDGNTIYYGTSDYTTLVTNHIAAIGGGSGTGTGTGTTTAPGTTPTGGGGSTGGSLPKYSQCGGTGWTGSGTCAAGSSCTYSNQWYSQCL